MTTVTHISQSEITPQPSIDPAILDSFNCPISYEPMNDPVICADGQTYNRSSIETWFASGNITSPLTGAPLPHLELIPNIVLRNIIRSHFPSLSSSATSLPTSSTPPPSLPSSPISSYLQHPINHDNYSDNILRRYIRRIGHEQRIRRNQQRREANYDNRMAQTRARLNLQDSNNNNNQSDLSNNILNDLIEIVNLINNNHLDSNNNFDSNNINSSNLILSHINSIVNRLISTSQNFNNQNFNNQMSLSAHR